jgi:hypothetical protein
MPRKLRKLLPDDALFRRRAAGEPLRDIAPDYDVSHTSLARYFRRPAAVKQLKRAAQLNRAEERAEDARWRAEQRAAEARALREARAAEERWRAEQRLEREALRRAKEERTGEGRRSETAEPGSGASGTGPGSRTAASRSRRHSAAGRILNAGRGSDYAR